VSYRGSPVIEYFYSVALLALGAAAVYALASWPVYSNSPDGPLVRAVFEEVNRIRAKGGVPLVEFVQLEAPLFRARYMYGRNALDHYDAEGRHPVYYYTLLDGGAHAVEENIGAVWCRALPCTSEGAARLLVRMMAYNDSHALWSHRDSLLDPCHNKVAVAVAGDPWRLYVAVYMVGEWAEWAEPPSYRNGTFSFRGYVRLPPAGPSYEIAVYRHGQRHGGPGYSLGELIAIEELKKK